MGTVKGTILAGRMCVLSALLFCAGCALPRSLPDRIMFSPDSRTIACIWLQEWCQPWLDGDTLCRTIHLDWSDVASPARRRSVRIGSLGLAWAGYVSVPTPFEFSPDSRRLAIVLPWRLTVVDLDTARRRVLSQPGEAVSSFAWLGDDEIAYVCRTNRRGEYNNITDRTFWRQKLADPLPPRAVIHYDEGVPLGIPRSPSFGWPQEHWSVGANRVVLATAQFGGSTSILDVRTGALRTVWRSQPAPEHVSWKGDGSAVCLARGRIQDHPIRVSITDPAAAEVQDIGPQLLAACRPGSDLSTVSWAYGDRYLYVESWHSRATPATPPYEWSPVAHADWLVCPRPWRVWDIGAKVAERFGPQARVYLSPHLPGGGLWTYGPDKESYGIDPTGTKFRLLHGEQWPAVSPDGKLSASVDLLRRLTVRRLQPPRPAPATQPAPPPPEPNRPHTGGPDG